MDIEVIEKAYRRYAQGYDLYFGAVLQPGRRAVIRRMAPRGGERILEVGVGTGLSLPLYPHDTQVTGIDVSTDMLTRARQRRARHDLVHVVALRRMDGERMAFPDDSFDKVVAMYVVSVAPDPVRLVNEMRRVCASDGMLYIVNHFRNANPVVSGCERLIAPFSRAMGFRPDFPLEDFLRETRLDVAERVPVNAFGYWTLLCAHNNKATLPNRRDLRN
ncbi:MAG: class I SAM-dependent methyltransferase [Gammaproteobacteria bacterium]|nr:MAG: class I SAM-dependent methyltransferase [Gammaproteobacteria bacterium]